MRLPTEPRVVHPSPDDEFETAERCHILESWNAPEDLVFYCICSPAFRQEDYEALE